MNLLGIFLLSRKHIKHLNQLQHMIKCIAKVKRSCCTITQTKGQMVYCTPHQGPNQCMANKSNLTYYSTVYLVDVLVRVDDYDVNKADGPIANI